ncbi:MAG: hypothetical protein KC421_27315 [Anaerolineales bacterium]|nr:hypothetical protein [Anaerolineales bacterium]
MVHILFPSLLYSIGLIPILFNRNKQISPAFFGWTAFAWGSLLWVVAFIFCLYLSIPYTLINIMTLIVIMLAIAGILLRGSTQLPGRNELKKIWPAATLFFFTMAMAHLFDLGRASPDSLMQLLLANELTAVQIAERTLAEFGYWGPMLAALHAPAAWFGYAYVTTLQAAFSITMIGSLGYFSYRGLMQRKMLPAQARLVAILVAVFLLTVPFVNFQFYYIHNNIVAAMYLLIGVGALWLGLTNKSRTYHRISILAFLGFSLTRTESILFAVVILAIALSSDRFPDRDWLIVLLPFTLFLAGWQLWLFFVARPATHILTPERILILLGVTISFYLTIVVKGIPLLNRLLIRHLHQIMILVFVLATIIMLFVDPEHVFLSIKFLFLNLLTEGWSWWGIVWWIVVAWLLSFPYASSIPQERLFAFGIVGYFMLLMVVGFAHGPGHLGWSSSPNRMYLHILPVIFLYLTLKTAPLMMSNGWVSRKTPAVNQ